jgi:hypothetical protein
MKKALGFAIGLTLLVPMFASARTITINAGSLDCDSGVLTQTGGATTTYSTDLCHSGGGPIVGTIPMSWGLLDGQTPIVPAGTIVHDERGLTGICAWYIASGCYDLTHTNWYRERMGYIK